MQTSASDAALWISETRPSSHRTASCQCWECWQNAQTPISGLKDKVENIQRHNSNSCTNSAFCLSSSKGLFCLAAQQTGEDLVIINTAVREEEFWGMCSHSLELREHPLSLHSFSQDLPFNLERLLCQGRREYESHCKFAAIFCSWVWKGNWKWLVRGCGFFFWNRVLFLNMGEC